MQGVLQVSRAREQVQARHIRMVELRNGMKMTLKQIAAAVGLTNHSTVSHHLSGACVCGMKADCEHEWQLSCRHCGKTQ